jgi:DMSO/TMAO reductase YedYZ molybdopterin-dependent catalytic subunit
MAGFSVDAPGVCVQHLRSILNPMIGSRRKFLALGPGIAALTSCEKKEIAGLGADMRPYGDRAPQEKSARVLRELSGSRGVGSSRTPLQDLYGAITPSSLHFERHHSGVPALDPATHSLLVHGMVERPLIFTMDDIRRFPSKSRICFLECGGNSVGDQQGKPPATAQQSLGLVSGSQWTGTPLSIVLREAKVKPEAKWVIAEGADSCRMSRSIPIEKALGDALVAYGQNGEALRPEQGYPLRLIVPGWEGNTNVKWLHRLNVLDRPAMSSEETAYYTDLMPSGKAEMFTFVIEAGGDYTAFRRPEVVRAGLSRNCRDSVVGQGQNPASGSVDRCRKHLERRRTTGAGSRQSLDGVSPRMELERRRDGDSVPLYRRDWIPAAHARGIDRGSRSEQRVSLQRDQAMEGGG